MRQPGLSRQPTGSTPTRKRADPATPGPAAPHLAPQPHPHPARLRELPLINHLHARFLQSPNQPFHRAKGGVALARLKGV